MSFHFQSGKSSLKILRIFIKVYKDETGLTESESSCSHASAG